MAKSKIGGVRLVALPFTTFGEIIALDLVAHVYCPSCYDHRSIDPSAEHLRARCIATARFRCTTVRHIGEVCRSLGSVEIQPAILLPVGGPDPLAFLSCKRCLPSWEINHVPINQSPWSLVNREAGGRFRCPGCRRPVSWHIPGPAWRPSYAYAQADTVMSGRAIRLGVK